MHEYSKRIGEHIKSCYSDFNKMTREELDELKAWACVMKDLTEYDINKRGIEAMDEAEQEEKFYGRMGYRGRAANGRFVHRSGRGRSAGYTPYPYLHMMEDDMDDYDMYDEMPYPMTGYRMGYTGGNRGGNMGNSSSSDSYSGNYGGGNSRSGYEGMRQPSRYGESYDRYSDRRRHYHESGDADSKKKMEDSIGEVFDDMENVVQDVWKEMTPEQKQKYKARMTQMVQKMQ
mgnify:FL=1